VSTPLVSVVIATWNTARYLPATLASALGQTWPNLEVIVVDDGSTDDTAEVITPFLPRIRYVRRSHRGLAAARNEGVRLARGDYIALLDADDLWLPEKIAVQVEIAARHPETGLVACNAVEFDDDQVLREDLLFEPFLRAIAASPSGEVTANFERELITGNGISAPSQVLIPRRVLQEIGPFIDSGAQDYDYYLRVSRRFPVTVHRHHLARWRYRPDAMSGAHADRPVRWGLYALPVLLAHRTRCRAEYRPLLEARIRGLTMRIGQDLMTRGRERGRLAATSHLLTVLRARPWPPTALMHLAGLWIPKLASRIGARPARPPRATG
jgi:glycosyltransferase involved in cell wall biosynthesis